MVTRLLRLDAAPTAGRRRRRARPGHLSRLAARRPAGPAAAPRRRQEVDGDRLRQRPGRRTRAGTRPWSRSAASASPCSARRARSPHCGSATTPTAASPGRARGLADPVRLRRRRRAPGVRAAADRQRRRAAARPGHARGPPPGRAAPGGGHRGPGALTRVPGIGKKGAQRIVARAGRQMGPPSARSPRRGTGSGCSIRRAGAARSTPRCRPRLVRARGGSAIEPVSPLAATAWTPRTAALLKAALRTLARPMSAGARAGRDAGAESAGTEPSGAVGDARRRRRRARRRGGAAPAHAGRVHRAGTGARAARARARGGPRLAAGSPTTCCSPARPASARPPWR